MSEQSTASNPDQAAGRREAGGAGGLFNEFIEGTDIKDITALFEILEFIDLFECREFYLP